MSLTSLTKLPFRGSYPYIQTPLLDGGEYFLYAVLVTGVGAVPSTQLMWLVPPADASTTSPAQITVLPDFTTSTAVPMTGSLSYSGTAGDKVPKTSPVTFSTTVDSSEAILGCTTATDGTLQFVPSSTTCSDDAKLVLSVAPGAAVPSLTNLYTGKPLSVSKNDSSESTLRALKTTTNGLYTLAWRDSSATGDDVGLEVWLLPIYTGKCMPCPVS